MHSPKPTGAPDELQLEIMIRFVFTEHILIHRTVSSHPAQVPV